MSSTTRAGQPSHRNHTHSLPYMLQSNGWLHYFSLPMRPTALLITILNHIARPQPIHGNRRHVPARNRCPHRICLRLYVGVFRKGRMALHYLNPILCLSMLTRGTCVVGRDASSGDLRIYGADDGVNRAPFWCTPGTHIPTKDMAGLPCILLNTSRRVVILTYMRRPTEDILHCFGAR